MGSNQVQKAQNDGERIVVHVKQDGTYQKTVEKLPAPAAQNKKKRWLIHFYIIYENYVSF